MDTDFISFIKVIPKITKALHVKNKGLKLLEETIR
jgi:hypothetical protein